MRLFLTLLVMVISINSIALADSTDTWKDQILYFVLLDRFYDGNKQNCINIDKKDLQAFHGGDIAGLEQKLDYLEELGITGIWVSPFLKNRPNAFFGQEAYHGYWPYDFFKIDERFGTEKELISLRESMKKRNIKLLLDMVVNHMGYDAPFVDEHKDWFNPMANINNWEDPDELKNRCIFGLPDFASQKPEVKRYFCEISKYWIDLLHPDGFRLDAVKHINDDFWKDFNENARKLSKSDFILLGEYLHGDPVKINETWRSTGFNCLFDFPLYYTMKEVFAQNGDCRKLASRLYYDRYYPDAGMLATLLDNHDLDRFITSCKGDINRYKLAIAFMMTVRGIPTLCYGDEQALRGSHRTLPHNRCDMKFTTNSEIFNFTKEMISMRKSVEALRRGLHCHIYADKNIYVFARLLPDQLVLVAFNNSEEPQKIDLEFPFIVKDKQLVPSYGDKEAALLTDYRIIKGKLAAKSFAVYIPKRESKQNKSSYEDWNNRFKDENYWGKNKIRVVLKVNNLSKESEYYLIGNSEEIGNWNVDKAVLMKPTGNNTFEAEVEMPIGKIFDCKCLSKTGKKIKWMEGDNLIEVVKINKGQKINLTW